MKYESGKLSFKLKSLTKASCVALAHGLQFRGEGTGKLGTERDAKIKFAFSVIEGKGEFSATIAGMNETMIEASPLAHSTEVIQ